MLNHGNSSWVRSRPACRGWIIAQIPRAKRRVCHRFLPDSGRSCFGHSLSVRGEKLEDQDPKILLMIKLKIADPWEKCDDSSRKSDHAIKRGSQVALFIDKISSVYRSERKSLVAEVQGLSSSISSR